MKIKHIIIIVVLVVILGIVISTVTDSGTYADFSQAAKHPGREFHIIGKLSPGKPLVYDPLQNPDEFIFYMLDGKGREQKVIYRHAKPRDFEKTDKVVIAGSMKGSVFEASSLLLKCPSKYNDQHKPAEFEEKSFH